MKMSNELKTGAVIFAAIAIFIGIMYRTGEMNAGKGGYTVKTRMGFAAGVKKFSPVRLAGVEVGELRDLVLLYEPNETVIEATLWLSDGVKLRKDSTALVSTLGLMGEKYIEIKPGTAGDFVQPGDSITGESPVSLEDVMAQVQDVAADIKKLVNNVNSVFDENRDKLSRMMDNLESTTEYFNEFAEDVRHHPWKVLSKGKEMTPEEMEKKRAERKAKKLAIAPPGAAGTVETAAAAPSAGTKKETKSGSNFSKGKK